eukprot:scaffold229290_cov28-Tisochrysis_lutea.AAC.1
MRGRICKLCFSWISAIHCAPSRCADAMLIANVSSTRPAVVAGTADFQLSSPPHPSPAIALAGVVHATSGSF